MTWTEPAVIAASLNRNAAQVGADADVDEPFWAWASLGVCLGVLHSANHQIVRSA